MSPKFLKKQTTLSLLLAACIIAPVAVHAQATDAAADPATTSTSAQAATPSAPTPATTTPPALDQSFFHRLGRAYVADWAGNGPGSAIPETRRGTPAPITSPPFPSADWPIGGTPTIGTADGQTYPLMQAINQNKTQQDLRLDRSRRQRLDQQQDQRQQGHRRQLPLRLRRVRQYHPARPGRRLLRSHPQHHADRPLRLGLSRSPCSTVPTIASPPRTAC